MADNGYFIEEPMIGIPSNDNCLIVVEGNRRLATLKLLTDSKFRDSSKYKEDWERLFSIAKAVGRDLSKVPIIVHANRAELDAIIGFRHITSTLKWDPLCKARFIFDLIERKKVNDLSKIAKEIGARQVTLKSNLIAYNIYNQAKDLEIDVSRLEQNFGVFYTALNNADIRDFLGLDFDKPLQDLKKPISNSKRQELKDFIELLHGNSKVLPVITDSRQIYQLGEVLAVESARKA